MVSTLRLPERLRSWYSQFGAPMCAFILLLGLWYAAVLITRIPDFILPTPDKIVSAFLKDYDSLVKHTLVTLQELAIGLIVGILVGIIGAFAITWSDAIETVVMPWIVLLHNVPKIVVAPLFVLWLGYDILPKIVVVVLVVFFPILVTTVIGLKSLETEMLDLTRSMGATKWQVFAKARFPASLPYFFGGFKVAASLATIGAIVGEWMGAQAGLGYLLIRAHDTFQTGLLFATMIVLAAMGMLLYQLVVIVERIALPWHVSVRESETISL